MIKETVIPTSTVYPLNIPENWIGKPVTIVYDEEYIEKKSIENNSIDKEDYSMEAAKKFYDSIRLDFSNFKFNRDEANER